MLEIIIILSVSIAILDKAWKRYWMPYLVRVIQVLAVLLLPMVVKSSFAFDVFKLNQPVSFLTALSIFLIGIEAEHFKINRWIKEVIFNSFVVLLLTSSVSVTMIMVLVIQTLLMVSKTNKFLDFVIYFIFTTAFCMYFSELSTTYLDITDKYIIFYSNFAESVFPKLLIMLFTFSIVTTWARDRSSSITPLFTNIILLINLKNSVVNIESVTTPALLIVLIIYL